MAFFIAILLAFGFIDSPTELNQFFNDNPEMHEIIIASDFDVV